MNQTEITNQIRWPKMFPVLILRKALVAGLTIFLMLPAMAQREKGESLITRDQISKISELVKPLVDQLDKQLRDDETYKAYVRDIEELNYTKSFDGKSELTKKINEKYKAFFQKVWAGANVDEKAYQLRIKQVFPDDISKLVQFEQFLVFTLNVSTVTTTTPSEPPPPDKCLDVCPMTMGEITGTGALIAGSGGSYGNCFLRTNAWSAGIGGNQLFGYLRNGITIPGTLPNDSRKLRVIKKYELMQEATSFAVLGGGYAETRARTYKTSEYMLVYSPVIFGASAIKIKSMSENYLLEKKDVAFSIFKTYAQTFSAFISGNWCYSNCFAIRWTICEEK